MESINHVLDIIKPGAYMASVDLKDAFYTIPIQEDHIKYLKFYHGSFYEFLCMPNGYSEAMRVFTKILKPPFAHLRTQGHLSVVYVDDTYLQGDTYSQCLSNVEDTISMLRSLGFCIHMKKSVLVPTQTITFLGFIVNSINMTISLTTEKREKIKKLCEQVLYMQCTIRKLASLIGNIVASFPAVMYGPLYYRHLETDKAISLKKAKGDFDQHASLTEESKIELEWWIHNIPHTFKNIVIPNVDITIHTDASLTGWGITDDITPSGGQWLPQELEHINILELKAAYFGILAYCKNKSFRHVRVMMDSVTAIAYINNLGGFKSLRCNTMAKEIWTWCIEHDLHVSAAHIPGVE